MSAFINPWRYGDDEHAREYELCIMRYEQKEYESHKLCPNSTAPGWVNRVTGALELGAARERRWVQDGMASPGAFSGMDKSEFT